MLNDSILREAKLLIDRAWEVAKDRGIPRTKETEDRIGAIFRGTAYSIDGSFHCEGEPGEQDVQAQQNASNDETFLALCRMLSSQAIVPGRSESEALSLLCIGNAALGALICGGEIGPRKIANDFFSLIGAKGGAAKNAPMARVREMAIAEYKAGKWPSARQASKKLKDKVFAFSKTIDGANMSEDCAQDRIYEWILAYIKSEKSHPSSR
jgi:hypothetical protein